MMNLQQKYLLRRLAQGTLNRTRITDEQRTTLKALTSAGLAQQEGNTLFFRITATGRDQLKEQSS